MKHFLIWVPVFLCFAASAQQTIDYTVSFPNAVHHEAEITVALNNLPSGELTFRMSRSSPGRYATHEFGKNVYDVQAFDGNGRELEVRQTEGDVYRVSGHKGAARIHYTIFGNHVDGTYLAIDETHAHLNIPATFIWFPAMTDRQIRVRFNDLQKYNWKVATQLQPSAEKDTYIARDFQYFMDSPIELSDYRIKSWKVPGSGGVSQTINLVSHGTSDPQSVIDGFAGKVETVTHEMAAVYGEFPKFDYGQYTFLQDVNPDNSGDGMEHRNSTVITSSSPAISSREDAMLSTFSHEFFHAWNVERIRPASLEPFDFSHANMSSDLWFAEGFTQYYGNLILHRAGFRSEDQYLGVLGGIINAVLNSPGPRRFPVTHMSRYAVFVDAGVSVDQNNYANTFTSYYTYGAAIALALDLRLRSEFRTNLDEYMKAVWKAHGKTEKPYRMGDLQNVLAGLTNPNFAADFFSRYVDGTNKSDYAKLLSEAGLSLQKANPGKAYIGALRLTFIPYTGKNRVANPTQKGSPLYEAGVDIGDYLLSIGDNQLSGEVNLEALLAKYRPGQEVKITFESKGIQKTATLRVTEDPALTVKPASNPNQQQLSFRKSWLSSQLK